MYKSGRYHVGVGHTFIEYPTNVQDSQLQLVTRSRDGMTVTLSCSYQYQLIPDLKSITFIYKNFDEKDYGKAYDKVAGETIRSVAANFSSIQFFFNRSDIS